MASRTKFLAGVLVLLGALGASPAVAMDFTPLASAAVTCGSPAVADLATLITGPASVGEGGTITYAVRVENTGPCVAPNVTIDTANGGGASGTVLANWTSNAGACTAVDADSGTGFPCNLGNMDPGAVITFTSTYTVGSVPSSSKIITTYVSMQFLSTSDVTDSGSAGGGLSNTVNTNITGIPQGCSTAGVGGLAGLLAMLALGVTRRKRS